MTLEVDLLRGISAAGQEAVASALGYKDPSPVSRIVGGNQGVLLANLERFLEVLGYKVVPLGHSTVDSAKYELLLRTATAALQREVEELQR